TDSSMAESLASSMRDSVVLPAPDGEDKTSISPRRTMAIFFGLFRATGRFTMLSALPTFPAEPRENNGLFEVLHLLAELLDNGLELKPDLGEFHVVRFGAQRIGFPIELLGEEIEPASDRAAFGDQVLRLRNMG